MSMHDDLIAIGKAQYFDAFEPQRTQGNLKAEKIMFV
jgi:hypothetical protein